MHLLIKSSPTRLHSSITACQQANPEACSWCQSPPLSMPPGLCLAPSVWAHKERWGITWVI